VELRAGQTARPSATYNVLVTTGECKGAGTDASVVVTLIGAAGPIIGPVPLEATAAQLERGRTDAFALRAPPAPSGPPAAVTAVNIAHDGAGSSPDWFLDQIVVQCEGLPDSAFLCRAWLKPPALQRLLRAAPAAGAARPEKPYRVTVYTGTIIDIAF
jgi:PLAT/LH2 domain